MRAAGAGGVGRGHRVDVGALLAEAFEHHAAGEVAEAERLCRRILALDPDRFGALHLAGTMALEAGRSAEAVVLLDRAIALEGEVPAVHYALSRAFDLEGRPAEALLNRGNGLRAEGRLEEAADCYWQALALDPGLAGGYASLGFVLLAGHDPEAAIAHFRQALTLRPGLVGAELGLAHALAALGQLAEALDQYRKVMTIDPGCIEATCRLGGLCHQLGDFDAALSWYRKALDLRPNHAVAHYGQGRVLADRGWAGSAAGHFRQALAVHPSWPDARSALGAALRDLGQAALAVEAFRQGLDLAPDRAGLHSRLLGALRLDDQAGADQRAAPAQRFEEAFGAGPGFERPAHANRRDPERRLRIGYVSPDLRRSSTAPFLEALLAHHDRRQVEPVCYAEISRPDILTSRFKAMCDGWCETAGLDDGALAERIQADGIDILVDLAGHRPGNRLPMFARRPAPVQLSWLGDGDTTGLSAIDWRLTDAVVEPQGEADRLSSERLVRLPQGCRCWQPPAEAPPAGPPPVGRLTFGSFTSLAGLSPGVVAAWSGLLRRVPVSHLVLKSRGLDDPVTAAAVRARFSDHGLAPDRLELLPAGASQAERLALYGRIDLALDPFPRSAPGALCEALWMGVPVVTLAGDRPAARIGASLLTAAGLDGLIADSVSQYQAIATGLATDPKRRASLRTGLRPQLAGAPICDGRAFARTLEATYRATWRHWAQGG